MLSQMLSWLSRVLSKRPSTLPTSNTPHTPASQRPSSLASSDNPNSTETEFRRALDRVLQHEGGYVNHKDDPGGATKYGITERVARQHGYDGDMRELPMAVAREVYRQSYWDAVNADQFHPALAFQLFDAAVNHGPRTAIKLLQRSVAVTDDGVYGPVTARAVEGAPLMDVLLRFNATRLEYYTSLDTFSAFGRGWTRRVAGNLRYAAEDTE